MKKLRRAFAVAMLGVGLSTGLASAQTGTIGTTGPNSNNQATFNDSHIATLTASNTAGVRNDTDQNANSGRAEVSGNTTGGSATSGAANNTSMTSTSASLSNASANAAVAASFGGGSPDTASINNTGPNSNNQVQFNDTHVLSVVSTNPANVSNDTDQSARSGSAEVEGNTTGGNATSGSVSNSSSTSSTLVLSN